MDLETLSKPKPKTKIPRIRPGDSVKVSFKIKEATRERLQVFPGLVIKVSRGSGGGNFTIRRVASGIGVEHTFPFASPLLDKIEVVRHGKVRRAKLYYIRERSAKEARLKERREKIAEDIRSIVDSETNEWGIDIISIKIQEIELPAEMKRAMAKQAEAEREKRAIIIKSEGELEAAENLKEAAAKLSKEHGSLQLRSLQTIRDIAQDPSEKIVIFMPGGFEEIIKKLK